MTQNDNDLQALQKIWYQKLKESGFKDIENTNDVQRRLIIWDSLHFQTHYSPEEFYEKQEYFRRASLFLHDYRFKNKIEKTIWDLHSEGCSLRSISTRLLSLRVKMNKDTVNKIIVRLRTIMEGYPLGDDDGAS